MTTTRDPSPEQEATAQRVAIEMGGTFVPRRGRMDDPLRTQGTKAVVYIVERRRDRLRTLQGDLVWGEGLLKLRCSVGRQHPFLRAIAPFGGQSVDRVLDLTLGLGQDALHLSAMLEARVDGVEASRPLAKLTERGLVNLSADVRWGAAAARIAVRVGRAEEVLDSLSADALPVVYLDPMFESPLDAPPGFEVLRNLAYSEPLDPELVRAALRVASRRVVIKRSWRADRTPIAVEGTPACRTIRGRAVDYDVFEKELA